MIITINTRNAAELGKRLTGLHRSAFPSAVRNTLNDAAFKAKSLVPEQADENFTIRQKNLFKRAVVTDKAKGFNLASMRSKVGLDGNFGISGGLAKQETGGNIQGRKLIANDKARISGSNERKIQAKNLFSKIPAIGTPRNRIRGAKYIMIKKNSKKGTVFAVNSKRLTPIYTYRSTRISKVKKKPYIQPAAVKASRMMDEFFRKNAEFQFNKYLRS